jgi:hypothetical protein
MLKFNQSKKVLSGILITVMVTLNFSFIFIPKKARAIPVIVVGTPAQIAWDYAKAALIFAAKKAATTLIISVSQSIATWISNGFQGNPSFINDPARFAINIADITIGEFIFQDPSLNFLCKPFQLQLKLSLALQHRKFYQTINCTLSGVLQNGEDAYNNFASGDFINGGNWDSFLTMVTDPNATPEGAFLVMDSELTARIQNQQGTLDKELAQGQGSLSFRNCTKTTYDLSKDPDTGEITPTQRNQEDYTGNPFYDQSTTTTTWVPPQNGDTYDGVKTETTCKVTSPGTLIASRLFFGQTSGQRMSEIQIATAEGLDIIIYAAADALAQLAVNQLQKTIGALAGGNDQQYYSNDQTITQLQTQLNGSSGSVAGGSVAGGGSSSNSVSSNSLSGAKTVAQNELNDQISIEETYKNTQANLLNYIDGAGNNAIRGIFNTAVACNNSDNSNITVNRARATSIVDFWVSKGGTKDLQLQNLSSLNVSAINSNISTASSNISTLTTRRDVTLPSASTVSAVNALTSDLNSSPFHSATDAISTSSAATTYTWAIEEASNASTTNCSIAIPVL